MKEASLQDLKLELWLRMRNDGDIAWKTKDGKLIKLKDMETSHIINALNYFMEKERQEWIYDEIIGLTIDDIS